MAFADLSNPVGRELSLGTAARQQPNQAAIVTGSVTLTFAELHALVRQLAPRQPQSGVRHFRAPANVETIASVLAALETQTTFLPLHPRLSDAEAAQLVQVASGCKERRAVLLATSGSSGPPKLAIIGHGALLASARASDKNLGHYDDDRWLLCMPLAHAGGLSIVTRCLLARMPIVLLERFDPDEVLSAISEHRATLLSVVPAMLDSLMHHDTRGVLRCLRVILVGGAPLPGELRRRAHARGLRLLASYGCTEMASQVTTQRPQDAFDPELDDSGFALDGVEIRIRTEVPNQAGRIQVRGAMRMRGYVGEPPLVPEAWFDTRDLGRLDAAGRLHVLGRSDDVIITGGENVHPAEVESVLATDPRVVDVMVLGLPDTHYGQRVAALFVLTPAADPQSVLEASATRLASFKKPREHRVVDAIPRNAVGKPDRRQARLLFNP